MMNPFRTTASALLMCPLALAACGKHGGQPDAGSNDGWDADAGCYVFDAGTLDPTLVAQGQMLVMEEHCQQCHGSTLSGNNDGVTLPHTMIMQYPPNLTSDPATGLGCWTNDQVANAILNSTDNQDQPICGPMPHFSALGITQLQADAIVAYLRSLPVVVNDLMSGPSCTCTADSDCPPGQSCVDAGSDAGAACTCLDFACSFGGDGGLEDAGVIDAGPTDAGLVDAGMTDAGPVDAGAADAGPADAGPVDAGAVDAGPVDAGSVDAGAVIDAGPTDAGETDAGPTDAGTDAGRLPPA